MGKVTAHDYMRIYTTANRLAAMPDDTSQRLAKNYFAHAERMMELLDSTEKERVEYLLKRSQS